MESLTKENFWNEMEILYPKAMAHFKEWIDKYKSEHDWEGLFNEYNDSVDVLNEAPKYHELPVAMQFGIFCEYGCSLARKQFNCTLYLEGGNFGLAVRYSIPNGLSKIEKVLP